MDKQELLTLLYAERQRLLDRYVKPGWNRWVLFGAMYYCVFSLIDLYDKHAFLISNVFPLLKLLSFTLFTLLLLFSKKIVGFIRGIFEEQLKLESIKTIKSLVGIISKVTIVAYMINLILYCSQFIKIKYEIDYSFTLIVMPWMFWILLVLLFLQITLAPIFENRTIKEYKILSFGNLSMFIPFMFNKYYAQWSVVDVQFSIILIAIVSLVLIYWYLSFDKDISQHCCPLKIS